MSRIFPNKAEKEARRVKREQAILALARARERNQRMEANAVLYWKCEYPLFDNEQERDLYLARLIGRGYWVERHDVQTANMGVFFTVRDMKQRKGQIFPIDKRRHR